MNGATIMPARFITDPFNDPFLRDVAADTAQFQLFYGRPWSPHWDADENCNWRPFDDLNDNGVWDAGEPLNDDVGSDGIGPFDDGYPGPDPDGSEGNGKPDQGEPNFGILDKDESDQLGLTGFLISSVHTYDLNNDERNWQALSALPQPHGQESSSGVNLANHFSSYLFHLLGKTSYVRVDGTHRRDRRDRAVLHGADVRDGHGRSVPAEDDGAADLQRQLPVRETAGEADRQGDRGRREGHAVLG